MKSQISGQMSFNTQQCMHYFASKYFGAGQCDSPHKGVEKGQRRKDVQMGMVGSDNWVTGCKQVDSGQGWARPFLVSDCWFNGCK